MTLATVCADGRGQTVHLPQASHFPDDVDKVTVRPCGKERILSPGGTRLGQLLLGRRKREQGFHGRTGRIVAGRTGAVVLPECVRT